MENNEKKTDSWWSKKTKEEKRKFITSTIWWTLGAVVMFFALFGKMIFGADGDIFGGLGDWEAVSNWFVNQLPVFLKTGVAIVITFMVIALFNLLMKAFTTKGKKAQTVASLAKSLFKYVAFIICIFVVLGFWGVDTTTLLASLGVLTLIIGLGCQTLINDVVSGLFLVFDDTFHVGDIVVIDGFRGQISEIGIKSTRIMDAGGNIKTINNSAISTVVNLTDDLSVAICDCDIDYSEDIRRVEAVISANIARIKKDVPLIVDGPFYKGVSNLGESGVTLRFVAKCKEEDRFQVVRDLNREIKIVFDENNVNIPFPQIVVNKPVESAKVTKSDKKEAEAFVQDQKDLSKDIGDRPAQDN